MAAGSTVSSRRNTRRAIAIDRSTASASVCRSTWPRYRSISAMLAAKRSMADRSSSCACALPAASPSRNPASCASRARFSTSPCVSAVRASGDWGLSAADRRSAAVFLRSSDSPESATVRQANGRTLSARLSSCTLDDILIAASRKADHALGLQLLDLLDDLLLGRFHVLDPHRTGCVHVFLEHLGAAL